MNKHFIELGMAVKVNYYKVFHSSVFSMNFLLLFSALQCHFIAVLTCQTFSFIGFLEVLDFYLYI